MERNHVIVTLCIESIPKGLFLIGTRCASVFLLAYLRNLTSELH